jgi:thioredoxin 1
MRNFKCKCTIIILILLTSCPDFSFGQNIVLDNKQATNNLVPDDTMSTDHVYKITLIELGSVSCLPCREMQPIIKSIEKKYGREVRVVFHDVLSEEGQSYGVKFGIKAIPTQVFLDSNGKEYYRHVGFFSEEELVSLLKKRGVKENLMDTQLNR